MKDYRYITKEVWDCLLEQLISSYSVYAAIDNGFGIDYELIGKSDIPAIIYNIPKPYTPVKSFFLPVKENVTSDRIEEKQRIVIGVPNCDVSVLGILDEIYLDSDFHDLWYKQRRENTLLIASDCFGIQEHCHCTSYGVQPYCDSNADLSILNMNGNIIFRVLTLRGEKFLSKFNEIRSDVGINISEEIKKRNASTVELLKNANKGLPGYSETGRLISVSKEEIWKKYSAKCVSCGACTTICPTCTCFLLIDKPGFEKIKQMDACQYPGFERVAGGEDALSRLSNRFRNRYLCKYVWKPQKFGSLACTGCGRCIEACIGRINKNEIFMELAK